MYVNVHIRWDFAGDGYVHRLILNSDEIAIEPGVSVSHTDSIEISGYSSFVGGTDSLSHTDILGRAATKIVEVVDPRLSQDEFGLYLYNFFKEWLFPCMYGMYTYIHLFYCAFFLKKKLV